MILFLDGCRIKATAADAHAPWARVCDVFDRPRIGEPTGVGVFSARLRGVLDVSESICGAGTQRNDGDKE
jgi:hypothetical protein